MKYETYLDGNHDWRWCFVADNGRIIADSAEGYRNYSDCLRGIELIKGSKEAPVIDRRAVKSLANALLGIYAKPRSPSLLGSYTIAAGDARLPRK